MDVIQPDVGRVGGLTEAKRVCDYAEDRGILVVPHCWKSAIGIAASTHLSATTLSCPYIEFLPKELAESQLREELVLNEHVQHKDEAWFETMESCYKHLGSRADAFWSYYE